MLQMTTLPDDGARPGLEKGVTGRSDEALGLGNDVDGRTADALSASDDGPCPGPQHSQMMASSGPGFRRAADDGASPGWRLGSKHSTESDAIL